MPLEILNQLLFFDPAEGRLTWKERPREMFKTDRHWKTWNTKYSGKPALTYVTKAGYCVGTILYKTFQAHRVIYAMQNGTWPNQIDHENGKRSDNRASEIRPATHQQNCQNHKLRADNKSGVCGVYLTKREKWKAYIRVDKKLIHLGSYDLKSEAISVRKAAEKSHGFHPNHGRQS